MTTDELISLHLNDDIRQLALKLSGRTDVDATYIVEQVAGHQKARTKLPSWAATDGIIYPPHLALEQCSSEQTATYKARVAQRLTTGNTPSTPQNLITQQPHNLKTVQPQDLITPQPHNPTTSLTDLTGGFGVDFSFMARVFRRATYVERQSRLCDIVRHNTAALGLSGVEVICAEAETVLKEMPHATMIYADPARRDAHGGRAFAVSDCSPDLLALRDLLLTKAEYVMVKLSPMLDWRKAVADFGGCVGEVHIVSVANECKELLLIMSAKYSGLNIIRCINDGSELSFTPDEEAAASASGDINYIESPRDIPPRGRLYIPNASVMKAGCFALTALRYACRPMSRDSHVFVSSSPVEHFPGRQLAIRAVSTMNKREIKAALGNIRRANVAVRNFPMTADALRRRLKLADGGDDYLFGTTTADGTHTLILATRNV